MHDGKLADRSGRSAFRVELEELLFARIGGACALFFVGMGAGSVLDVVYFPAHRRAMLVSWLVMAAIWTAALVILRRAPFRVRSTTLIASLSITFCVGAYYGAVDGDTELCALTLVVLQMGYSFLNPWGALGQGVVAGGGVLAYLLAVAAGARSSESALFGFLALTVTSGLTTFGAAVLDRHRYASWKKSAEIERISRAKSEFVSTLSHELRSPLAVIVGYAEMLADGEGGPLADAQTGLVRRIREQCGHALDLIENTLDLNRLEAGALKVDAVDFRLAELLERLRSGIPPDWVKPGVMLDWRTRGEQTLLHSDRRKLEIVVRNLVHNALKFTDEGLVRVDVKPLFDSGQLLVSVKDTGPGVAVADRTRIFEMYERSGDGTRAQGAGFGLHLVKRYAELLGGNVSLESEPGAGSTFTVTVPLRVEGARPTSH